MCSNCWFKLSVARVFLPCSEESRLHHFHVGRRLVGFDDGEDEPTDGEHSASVAVRERVFLLKLKVFVSISVTTSMFNLIVHHSSS